MTEIEATPGRLASRIADEVAGLAAGGGRRLVAIAGPPGSGKSTVAALARDELERRGLPTGLLAMDGFHLDNRLLAERGLTDRKGAPETFDVAGFGAMLERLLAEDEVAVPQFDRGLDLAIAARGLITAEQRTVIVEGNYLLLRERPWSDLAPLWSLRLFLDVPSARLEARLVRRWIDWGLSADAARRRAVSNDLPNAALVIEHSAGIDLRLA